MFVTHYFWNKNTKISELSFKSQSDRNSSSSIVDETVQNKTKTGI